MEIAANQNAAIAIDPLAVHRLRYKIVAGTTANGTFAFRSFQLDVDPSFLLTPAIFVGPRFLDGRAEQDTFRPLVNRSPSDYVFNSDGSWLFNGVTPFGALAAAWSNPDGRLEFTFTSQSGFFRQDVSWLPVAVIGDRYWVLEARQLGNVGDVFVDLGTTTGFLAYYRAVP